MKPAVFILLLLAATSAPAQVTLTSVFLTRGQENVQTGDATVVIDPTPVSATYGGPLNWGLTVRASGLTSAPRLTTMPLNAGNNNATLNPAQHNDGYLGDADNSGEWRYGSPHFNNLGFAANMAANRNQRFPVGTYTVTFPGTSLADVSLNYQNSAVPLSPVVFTLSGGTWSNGVYYVDPTQAVHVVGSVHNGFASGNVNGAIWYDVYDNADHLVAGLESVRFRTDAEPGANFIDFTIAANTLTAGQSYGVAGGHAYITDQNGTNGSLNLAFFETVTNFQITAIPEPSTYAAFAGLGALGLALWRRRKQADQARLA